LVSFRPRVDWGRPTVMGSRELPDQDANPGGNANPWGPTILTTTVAMLLEGVRVGRGLRGLGVDQGAHRRAPGGPLREAADLLDQGGRHRRAGRQVEPWQRAGGRVAAGQGDGVQLVRCADAEHGGHRGVRPAVGDRDGEAGKLPDPRLGVPPPIQRMVTARSALTAGCACAVASGTAVIGIRATTTATPARPSLRPRLRTWFMADSPCRAGRLADGLPAAARPAPSAGRPGANAGRWENPAPRPLVVQPSIDVGQRIQTTGYRAT
jgi:hypothetical protein